MSSARVSDSKEGMKSRSVLQGSGSRRAEDQRKAADLGPRDGLHVHAPQVSVHQTPRIVRRRQTASCLRESCSAPYHTLSQSELCFCFCTPHH